MGKPGHFTEVGAPCVRKFRMAAGEGMFKVGIALGFITGSCLVVLGVMAMSQSTSVDVQTTNLAAMPTSLRGPLAAAPSPTQSASCGSLKFSIQAYSPFDGKKYETLSYLPQISNQDIEKQISYMIRNSWTPGLEFSQDGDVYLNTRMGPGYYDNRYWSMYKLPMFGCTDPSSVVREIENCSREFPGAKVRVIAYDSIKQVQVAGFIVRK